MHFNTIYFSLLSLAMTLSCKPEKKTIPETQPHDTIKTHISSTKEHDSLTKSKKIPVIDTTAVLMAFKKASQTEQFGKDLYFNLKDELSGSIFDSERPILIGDLNGDHLEDAIMPFSIEGRDGGNNWDAHYAVFINKDGQLKYQYSFDRGADLAETQTFFKSIEDGVVEGMIEPGFHVQEGESIPVNYIYKNNRLVEVTPSSKAK
ncbi:hypothetical protein [Chryseobacterium sp. YR221]|uniref:hypothetical protein n=1 Tax=Chryseobacterium sp. YR221 TaxID=1500293 RepID=UPI0009D8084D|nr:hypothetical protein [Chryseobacterium sp. YR221]SMC35239.1 hypothetical protein SAMN02787074_0579 [Chryseobacterium sp. YR221]